MKNKKIILFVIFFLLILSGTIASVWTFRNARKYEETKQNSVVEEKEEVDEPKAQEYKYKLVVKNAKGEKVSGILAAFYDADSKMIDTPKATNSAGMITYTSQEQGNYSVGIVAVPYRYTLDSEIKNFEKGMKQITVVLEDNPNAYVAEINGKKYTLKDAIEIANGAEMDMTIKLISDAYITEELVIYNELGKTITIDGNGHKLELETSSHSIQVNQKTGVVNFKNLNIIHAGIGNVIRIGRGVNKTLTNETITVNMTDVNITTTSSHQYTVIHTKERQVIHLNMTRVKLDWDTTTESKGAGAIMAAVGGMEQTFNLTLKDCLIDASGALDRHAILVTSKVQGAINVYNSKLLTNGVTPVKNAQMTFLRDEKTVLNDGKPNEARIGTLDYCNLEEAIEAANALDSDVTVTLLTDVHLDKVITINNKAGKAITIDGVGHTIVAEAKGHSFLVTQSKGAVTFKNMDIKHSTAGGTRNVVKFADYEGTSATAEDVLEVNFMSVNIVSDSGHLYGLIHFDPNRGFRVNMTKLNLDWDTAVAPEQTKYNGAITLGATNVELAMNGCVIDVSGAKGRSGIGVKNTKIVGTINMTNYTTIKTDGAVPVNYKNMTFIRDWSVVLDDGIADEAMIGELPHGISYGTLKDALKSAELSKEDVTITLLKDIVLSEQMIIDQTSNHEIALDGAGYTVTTQHSSNAFVVKKTTGTVTFKNLNLNHVDGGAGKQLMIFGTATATEGNPELNVTFENVNIESDSTNKYALLHFRRSSTFHVTMKNSNITWNSTTGGASGGAIRLGEARTDAIQNCLTIEGGRIETQTPGCEAIFNLGTLSRIELNSVEVKTAEGTDVLYLDNGANYGGQQYDTDGNCNFNGAQLGYDATVNGYIYPTLAKAITTANAVAEQEDVTVTLLQDITLASQLVIPNQEYAFTLDGAGHTLTKDTTQYSFHTVNVLKTTGNVTFKNLNLNHVDNNQGRYLMQFGTGTATEGNPELNVTFENVNLTSDSTNQYALLYFRKSSTFHVAMKNSNITWNSTTGGASGGAIRLGETRDDEIQNSLTIEGGKIETKTSGCEAIYNLGRLSRIELNSVEVKMAEGTDVLCLYSHDVYGGHEYVTDGNCNFNGAQLGYDATVNGYLYPTLADAITAANASGSDVEIKLVQDVTLSSAMKPTFANANRKFDIKGNGHTLTLGNRFFNTNAEGMTINIENLNIVQSGTASLIILNNSSTLTMKNVDIDSTCSHAYALIQANVVDKTYTLNMDTVDIEWNCTADEPNNYNAVIRINYACTLNMDITNSKINVPTNSSRVWAGIAITATGTTATTTVDDVNALSDWITGTEKTINRNGTTLMTRESD